MLVSRKWPVWIVCFVFCLALHASHSPAGAQPARTETAETLAEMTRIAGPGVSATLSPFGLVDFLRTAPGAAIPIGRSGTAEERARSFLEGFGPAFGVGPEVELTIVGESAPDGVGMEHVRFQQTYQGVPVAGGEISIHLLGDSVVAANANTLPDLKGIDTTPVVEAAEAALLAEAAVAGGLGVTEAHLSEPRLELLNRGLLGARGFATSLAWFVEVRDIDLREYVWIDARSGKVALRFSQLTDAKNRRSTTPPAGAPWEPWCAARGRGPTAAPGPTT